MILGRRLLALVPAHPQAGGVILVKTEGWPLHLEPLVDTTVRHTPRAPWNLLTALHTPAPANPGTDQSGLRDLPFPKVKPVRPAWPHFTDD